MNLASSVFGATTPELLGYSRVQRFFQIAIFPGVPRPVFFRHAPASLYNVQETGLLPTPASINAVCDTCIFGVFFLVIRCSPFFLRKQTVPVGLLVAGDTHAPDPDCVSCPSPARLATAPQGQHAVKMSFHGFIFPFFPKMQLATTGTNFTELQGKKRGDLFFLQC